MVPISFWRLLGKVTNRKLMHHGLQSWDKGSAYGINTAGIQLGLLDSIINDSRFFNDAMELSKSQFSKLNMNEINNGYSYGRMVTDLQNYLVDNVLSITDKTSMAASVEARVPFLDHNLVELVFSVPPYINLGKNGYSSSKQTLKNISKKYCQKSIK